MSGKTLISRVAFQQPRVLAKSKRFHVSRQPYRSLAHALHIGLPAGLMSRHRAHRLARCSRSGGGQSSYVDVRNESHSRPNPWSSSGRGPIKLKSRGRAKNVEKFDADGACASSNCWAFGVNGDNTGNAQVKCCPAMSIPTISASWTFDYHVNAEFLGSGCDRHLGR